MESQRGPRAGVWPEVMKVMKVRGPRPVSRCTSVGMGPRKRTLTLFRGELGERPPGQGQDSSQKAALNLLQFGTSVSVGSWSPRL